MYRMFDFLANVGRIRSRRSKQKSGGNRVPSWRVPRAYPNLVALEDRIAPALTTVSLDFETPQTGSVPQVTTSFGSIDLVGFYESADIDQDLAEDHGGTVLQSSQQSNEFGVGRIIINGALGTQISFSYGARAEANHPVSGSITAYTYSHSMQTQVSPIQPADEDVFKQFALNEGQPVGPVTLGGPKLAPIIGSSGEFLGREPSGTPWVRVDDGPGYFNSFNWTSGTNAGNVFSNSRPGAIQIDGVTLTVEPALDILRNSVHVQVSGPTITAQFKPTGANGPVPLKDLAAALGVDHFNWEQTIYSRSSALEWFRVTNVTAEHLGDLVGKNLSGNTSEAAFYSDGTPVSLVREPFFHLDPIQADPDNTNDQQFYAIFVKPLSAWGVVNLSDANGTVTLPDNLLPYLDERPGHAYYYGAFERNVDSPPTFLPNREGNSLHTLWFSDTPSGPAEAFTGDRPYWSFSTRLVGVKADGTIVRWSGNGTAFLWRSDAVNASKTITFAAPGSEQIVSGGVSGVLMDDDTVANTAPQAANDTAATRIGAAVDIDVLANDEDTDFGFVQPATIQVTSNPANGSVAVNTTTGVITYTPNAGFSGVDSFRYTVMDDDGGVSNEATVTVNVVQPPVAVNDSASTSEGAIVAVNVLANDSDPDGALDPTSVAVITAPTQGTIAVNPTTGAITYTPKVGFVGTDTFTYTVEDQHGVASEPATVQVTVVPGPVIEVLAGTVLAPNGTVNLGTIKQSTQPATRNFIIRNTGSLALSLGTVSITGTGYSVGQPGATILGPGESTSVLVTLSAATPGTGLAGTLTVPSNDPDGPFTVQLTADVVAHPHVLAVTRLDSGTGPLQVAIDFSEAMNAAAAGNVANFTVVGPGGAVVPLASAVYSETGGQFRVTLTSQAGGLAPGSYSVRFDGTKVLSAAGVPLTTPRNSLMVMGGFDNGTISTLGLGGDGNVGVLRGPDLTGFGPPEKIAVADFNRDGINDVVAISQITGELVFHHGLAGGGYADAVALALPRSDPNFTPIPRSLLTADWNNDSHPDLFVHDTVNVIGLGFVERVVVLLNDGKGNFSSAPDTPIPVTDPGGFGVGPLLGVADFTGDGQLDIALGGPPVEGSVSNYTAKGSIVVYARDPFLGYSRAALISTGHAEWYPDGGVVADLNKDGRMDLVVTTTGFFQAGPRPVVFLNSATGLGAARDLDYPGEGGHVAVGDFTSDGHLDIAVVNDNYSNLAGVREGGVISLLVGDGTGQFTARENVLLNRRGAGLAGAADLNGDGKLDLLLSAHPFEQTGFDSTPELSFWTILGDGLGGFTPAGAPVPIAAGGNTSPGTFVVTDFNGDGQPDALYGNTQTGQIGLAINDGTGQMRVTAPVGPKTSLRTEFWNFILVGESGVVIADLNRDGIPDQLRLVSDAGSFGPEAIDIFLGQSDGTFEFAGALAVNTTDRSPGNQTLANVGWLRVGDLNKDGWLDLVVGPESGAVAVYLGVDGVRFIPAPTPLIDAGSSGSVAGGALADVNGDGNLDLVALVHGVGYGVFFGNGTGTLTFNPNTFMAVAGVAPQSPLLVDVNGDGRPDLVAGGSDPANGFVDRLIVFVNQGNGTFVENSSLALGNTGYPPRPALAQDLNGDGHLDILAITFNKVQFFLGNGAGQFTEAPELAIDVGYQVGNLVAGDFTGDGKIDLAWTKATNAIAEVISTVAILPGDGAGHFGPVQLVETGRKDPWSLAVLPQAGIVEAGTITIPLPPDTTPPTVRINQAAIQADPTNAATINFTVVFSEAVTGFTSADVTLGGTAGATTVVVTGSGTTYNVAVSGMTASGTVTATVAAGVALDAAGNGNLASTSTDNTVTFTTGGTVDTTPPTVTIDQASTQVDPTNATTINFTVVFSEAVTGFDNSDVTLGGTAGATTVVVTGSGTTYNVAVSGMTQAGTVTVSIAAGAAFDAAGNGNTASTSTDNTVTFSTTPGVLPSFTLGPIIGTEQDDVILITRGEGDILEVRLNGVFINRVDPTALAFLVIEARGGNDSIEVAEDVLLPVSVLGEAGNDTLIGGAGDDTLLGGAGDDLMFGRAGNDQIFGEDGNDSMDGNDGNDSLGGGAGNDLMFGSAGTDLMFGEAGNDAMDGGDGNDNLDGGQDNDVVFGSAGNDLLFGSAGNDGMDAGIGDDSMDGGLGNDLMFGLDGNDLMYGLDGNDSMDGGFGNDSMDASSGNDLVFGSAGNDLIFGGSGNDAIDGNDGNDSIDAADGDDLIFGSGGNDLIFAGLGNDSVDGGPGINSIDGGPGVNLVFQ